MDREDLESQAEELGIDVDGRWSDETLIAKIDEKLSEDAAEKAAEEVSSVVYKKNITGKFFIRGFEVPEEFSPTDTQIKNEDFMRRLKHSVKCGHVYVATK